LEFLKKKDNEYAFDNEQGMQDTISRLQGRLSDEEMEKFKSLPPESTKWNPDEWQYDDFDGKSELAKINKLLYSSNSELDFDSEEDCKEWQNLFVETVISALQKAIQKDCFGLNPKEVVYFVCMTDADRDGEKIMIDSAKMLNDIDIFEEFRKDNEYDAELMDSVGKALKAYSDEKYPPLWQQQ